MGSEEADVGVMVGTDVGTVVMDVSSLAAEMEDSVGIGASVVGIGSGTLVVGGIAASTAG